MAKFEVFLLRHLDFIHQTSNYVLLLNCNYIGFGVCCLFYTSTCGTSVSQNCSYIRNPNHPSAYTSTSNCQFTIYKCDSSVCDFRLDFDQYLTNAPSATDETSGGICQVCTYHFWIMHPPTLWVHYPKENQSHFQSKLKNIYLILSTI